MVAMAARATWGSLPRSACSRWGALYALAGLAGLLLRVWAYRATLGTPDSDEAVMGLMGPVPQLEHYGYRRYPIGPFVVYAPR